MRRIETIRGLGRLVPPLICNRPGTGGRYLDQWSCHEEDQDLWNCREAQPSDTTPELWAAEGCGRALIQLPGPTAATVQTATVQTAPDRAPQAPPPAVSITDPERIRREQEDASRREWYRYHQENERARKERERIEAARLERERLERERIQAEQEQRRIQEELERNRRQLAERQQVTVTVPVNAPPGVETQKGSFPWWLLALLLASQ